MEWGCAKPVCEILIEAFPYEPSCCEPSFEALVITLTRVITAILFSSIHTGFDFGNYSCVAENSIGTFKYAIQFENARSKIDFVKLGNILKYTGDRRYQSSGLNPILTMIG